MNSVIPAKPESSFFQDLLDAPVSSTGQAPQVHDGLTNFIEQTLIRHFFLKVRQTHSPS
jgi:hypothetical protein